MITNKERLIATINKASIKKTEDENSELKITTYTYNKNTKSWKEKKIKL